MSDSDRTFTPSAFLDRLKASGPHGPPTGTLVIHGTVQPGPEDENEPTLLFDPTATCSGWVTVPIALLESVELLGERPCADHVHPFVALTFAQPSERAAVFARLAEAAQSAVDSSPHAVFWQTDVFRTAARRRRMPRRTFASPSGCMTEFGHAAHSFLSAFEAAGAGNSAAAAAWVEQFQSDYALYEACVALKHTL